MNIRVRILLLRLTSFIRPSQVYSTTRLGQTAAILPEGDEFDFSMCHGLTSVNLSESEAEIAENEVTEVINSAFRIVKITFTKKSTGGCIMYTSVAFRVRVNSSHGSFVVEIFEFSKKIHTNRALAPVPTKTATLVRFAGSDLPMFLRDSDSKTG